MLDEPASRIRMTFGLEDIRGIVNFAEPGTP
jgi:hypothetical protein